MHRHHWSPYCSGLDEGTRNCLRYYENCVTEISVQGRHLVHSMGGRAYAVPWKCKRLGYGDSLVAAFAFGMPAYTFDVAC